MKRMVLLYVTTLVVFVLGVVGILYLGKDLTVLPSADVVLSSHLRSAAHQPASAFTSLWSSFTQNFKDPIAPLLLQFIVIVLATRACGSLFSRFGQPAVIGEITAGILLGPSLLGWLWPDVSAIVFSKESLGILQMFSQIGVCLFMFVVGMELDTTHLRTRAQVAVWVSHASIVVPYLLGVGAAFLLYQTFAAPGTTFVAFALFMGIAMSITAFPVLARIIADRGMTNTPLGALAITCAAVDDATAWAILAAVVALVHASTFSLTIVHLALVVAFVAIMLWGVRPLLQRWLASKDLPEMMTRGVIASALIFTSASALTTQFIGIHALFGAFLAGAIMPRNKQFLDYLAVRLENFSSVFLLPLFFAFSGLRTQIGLLDSSTAWLACIGVIAVATAGKLGGAMTSARLSGMSWNDAFSLGALMNTRGLVELIALNIGYDLGVLPPRIFSIMVLMALATTFMTGPLLNVAELLRKRRTMHRAVALHQ